MKYSAVTFFVVLFSVYAIIAPPIIKKLIDKRGNKKAKLDN